MRFDCNFYGGVPMPDAGKAGPAPTDRRYGNDAVVAGFDNLVHWARTMDRLDYDTMWLTEHHFQYEGYEVVPNLIQFGLWLVSQTSKLRLGQMFNVVPQWHPLRLAEDYAMAQILSGDRMVFGVGRGTVPREAQSLGAVVASGDNEMSREADRLNRELFEEAMEVIKAAWWNETFSYTGKHFVFPPPGIPDRGATVRDLTLIPKPIAPIDIWQAVTSPETLEYAPRVRHHAVIPAGNPAVVAPRWERFGELAGEHGWELAAGEARCLAINCHLGDSRESALRSGRDAWDEWVKFLSPYGRFKTYVPAGGGEAPFAFAPSLEEAIDNRAIACGSPSDVAEQLAYWRDAIGVRHVALFFDMPGLTRAQMDEQLEGFATDVMPLLAND
ncbi:MAG: LLM class flavin-dependent oxidoreductase [Acidimicrobiales bacterium]|nr:LLM class flavin-dependent oxidoreductase [Acidimicrobiales bacterium]